MNNIHEERWTKNDKCSFDKPPHQARELPKSKIKLGDSMENYKSDTRQH